MYQKLIIIAIIFSGENIKICGNNNSCSCEKKYKINDKFYSLGFLKFQEIFRMVQIKEYSGRYQCAATSNIWSIPMCTDNVCLVYKESKTGGMLSYSCEPSVTAQPSL